GGGADGGVVRGAARHPAPGRAHRRLLRLAGVRGALLRTGERVRRRVRAAGRSFSGGRLRAGRDHGGGHARPYVPLARRVQLDDAPAPGAPRPPRRGRTGRGAVVAFAVTVLAFGLTLSWGTSDPLRREVGAQIDRSRIVALARATEPRLYELVRPWLPGGLPSVLAS